jgi:GT2 family glycosyltransferase
MQNTDGEIWVIDNHSTDDSCSFFQNRFPGVHFVWNRSNLGFAKACNLGLERAAGDYILFLNPDTVVGEDCFEKCIAYIHSRGDRCAIGVKMLDGAGNFLKESKRSFPSPVTSLYKLFGLSKWFPHSKTFAKYHLGNLSEDENHEVDVLAGAFLMVPRKILDQVGGFDEDFFMYGEDIDLSYRIQKAGFTNCYFAGTSIIHFKGESTRKGSLNYVKMFYKAMSIFVKKHYGGNRAGLFSFLVHTAIFIRALLSAVRRVLKWVGLPLIDAGVILMSFWIIKLFWNSYIKQDVEYSSNLLLIAFPAFTLLFLVSSYFAGLYDNGYKQSRLNKSTLLSVLVILSVYSLLPESLRFSRGILVFGSLAAFALMTLVRRLLLQWKIIEKAAEDNETNQTVIAGSEEEYRETCHFLENAGKAERILGRIATDHTNTAGTINSFEHLDQILQLHPVKEIIFCQGALSFTRIIETLPGIPHRVRIQVFSPGCHTIIGSNDKDTAGDFILRQHNYRLDDAVYHRSKTLFDIFFSVGMLLVFPLPILIKRRPWLFFRNVFRVLFRKNTWVGYASAGKNLPSLKPGILTTTGLSASANIFPGESLLQTDKLYARHYHVLTDLQLVWKNFQSLS